MKNTLKVALGFAVGGTLILMSQLKKRRKNQAKTFTAPDGNSYEENKMYRNAHGEIFKNGKKLHFDTPELLSDANTQIHSYESDRFNKHDTLSHQAKYHRRGARHW